FFSLPKAIERLFLKTIFIKIMTKITAAEVNKLRQVTGAGMMDCKKALVEAEGDFDKAIELLRKKGQKVAANRADRESTEGAVIAKGDTDGIAGVIIALDVGTVFVATSVNLVDLGQDLVGLGLSHTSLDSLVDADYVGIEVAGKLSERTGVIVEKIERGGVKE